MGADADTNAEADIRVRLIDPNGQKADEMVVRLGQPVEVAVRNVRCDEFCFCKSPFVYVETFRSVGIMAYCTPQVRITTTGGSRRTPA